MNAFEDCISLTDVSLPESVTSISAYCFKGCTALEALELPSNTISIGYNAFEDCTALTTLNLPAKLQTIGSSAFKNCTKLKSASIPDSVLSIGDSAYEGCTALSNVILGKSLKVLGGLAFANCTSLKAIHIPASVTTIGDGIFRNSLSMISLTVDDGNKKFCAVDNVLYNADKTVLIAYPAGKKDYAYTIIRTTEEVKPYAFYGNMRLKEISLPYVLDIVGKNAFNLDNGTININKIYWDNPNTTPEKNEIIVPCESDGDIKKLYDAYSSGFYNGGSVSVIVGSGSSSKPSSSSTDYTKYVCHGLITTIDGTLKDVAVYMTERNCTYPYSYIATTNYTIGKDGYYDSFTDYNNSHSIERAVIKERYTAEADVFYTNQYKKTENTGSIEYKCYYFNDYGVVACDTLSSSELKILFQSSRFDFSAVHNCNVFYKNESVFSNKRFKPDYAPTHRYVPPVNTTANKTNAIEYDNINYHNNGSTIGICGADSTVKSLELPSTIDRLSVTSIEANAFYNCPNLENITISDRVQRIGRYAFCFDSELEWVSIPYSVSSIDDYAFAGCTDLKDVYYNGSKDEWEKITVGTNNKCLLNANIHFNSTAPEAIEGDVNADGKFNMADAVLLQKWLLAVPDTELADWEAANLCEDGKLDVFDLCMMKHMLVENS